MLHIGLKIGEKLYIGSDGPDQICVTFLDNTAIYVRLGLEAPRHVEIFREEKLPPNHPQRKAVPSGK